MSSSGFFRSKSKCYWVLFGELVLLACEFVFRCVFIHSRLVRDGALPSKLRLLTPEEVIHALFLKIGSRITAGANGAELESWGKLCLSVPLSIEVLPSIEKMYWRGISIREAYGTNFDVLFRSATQRVFEIAMFRDANKLGSKEVAAKWKANVTFSTLTLSLDGLLV